MTSTTTQLEWTEEELLTTHPIEAPLIAGGVKCHGGFDENGDYVSPRTKNRWPAIDAWKTSRNKQFGTPLLDIQLDAWPEHYPNVAQTKYLISEGIPDPLIAILTRIGTPAAVRVLQELASGPPGLPRTTLAKSSLLQLGRE